MIKKIRLILFIIIPIFIGIINVDANTQKNLVNIYLIHSNTCSHCKEEINVSGFILLILILII